MAAPAEALMFATSRGLHRWLRALGVRGDDLSMPVRGDVQPVEIVGDALGLVPLAGQPIVAGAHFDRTPTALEFAIAEFQAVRPTYVVSAWGTINTPIYGTRVSRIVNDLAIIAPGLLFGAAPQGIFRTGDAIAAGLVGINTRATSQEVGPFYLLPGDILGWEGQVSAIIIVDMIVLEVDEL